MDILTRIKALVLHGRVRFTLKAREEMRADGLRIPDVVEAILNATSIDKVLRSRSPRRGRTGEKLYVIKSFNYQGTGIYTKGKIDQFEGQAIFYVFVSAKVSTLGDGSG
jgi:hypothetical protein